jgi:hypothetical protein
MNWQVVPPEDTEGVCCENFRRFASIEIVMLEKLDCTLKYRYIHGLIYTVVGVCLCMSCTHACALSWHLQLSGISS